MLSEVVDDPPVAVRDRLEQRPVDLLGRALQRQPEDRAGEVGVGEDRAVAVEPVEREQPGLARPECGRAPLQPLVGLGRTVQRADEPREHVADRRLSSLVAVQPGQDPVPSDARDAGQPDLVGIEHHVADRGPDHGHERPRALDPGAGDRYERVDVADRDRDLLGQPQQSRPLGGQRSGTGPERHELGPELGAGAREARVGGFEVRHRRQPVGRRPHRLVGRRARLTAFAPRQLPDDPVGGLDERGRIVVALAVLEPQLDQFREVPLRRDPAAVAAQELLASFERDLVEPIGDVLGGVVLPQLWPRVAALAPARLLTQWLAVGRHRQDRAGCEVDPDPDDLVGAHVGPRHDLGYAAFEHGQPVGGVLQRPIGRQPLARRWEHGVDHRAVVGDDADRELLAGARVEQQRTTRLGAEVDTDAASSLAHRGALGYPD